MTHNASITLNSGLLTLCEGNAPVTDRFPSQKASNAESFGCLVPGLNVSMFNHCGYNAHYDDVIMGAIASQITSLTIVYSAVYSGADQSKHQSSASLAFVWGIHRGPVNSPHKWPATRKMFPFDDVIMLYAVSFYNEAHYIKFKSATGKAFFIFASNIDIIICIFFVFTLIEYLKTSVKTSVVVSFDAYIDFPGDINPANISVVVISYSFKRKYAFALFTPV